MRPDGPVPALQATEEVAYAKRYVLRLMREGYLDTREGQMQLQAIERAARDGARVMVVADLDREPARRLRQAS